MTPLASRADLARDALQARGLVREQQHVGALGELGVGVDDLAAELGDERLGARPVGVVHEHGIAPAARERSCHVSCADEAESASDEVWTSAGGRGRAGSSAPSAAQDWLKKPFSISSAFSSAEICTLRGVSMKTLCAMRCIPPSSA